MNWVAELIGSGRIVGLMAVFVAIEVAALIVWRRRTGNGIPTGPLLANIGAGVSLMLALGAALSGASPMLLALALLASLGFHLLDLRLRWRRDVPG